MIKLLIRNISRNPYKVLGVNKQASNEEIKKAYFRLVKKYHPDVAKGEDENFKMINEAYCVLKSRENVQIKDPEPEFQYEPKDMLWKKEWTGFVEDDDEGKVPFYTEKKPLINFEIVSLL